MSKYKLTITDSNNYSNLFYDIMVNYLNNLSTWSETCKKFSKNKNYSIKTSYKSFNMSITLIFNSEEDMFLFIMENS